MNCLARRGHFEICQGGPYENSVWLCAKRMRSKQDLRWVPVISDLSSPRAHGIYSLIGGSFAAPCGVDGINRSLLGGFADGL